MSRIVVKLALGAIAVPTMWAYGTWEKGKVAELYNITEIDRPVYEQCDKEMDAKNMMFEDAAASLGCACIAKLASSEYTSAELPVVTKALSLTIDHMEETVYLDYDDSAGFDALEIKYKAQGKRTAQSVGWSPVKFEKLTDRIWQYEETCGVGDTHRGESQTRIAALMPKGSASSVERVTPDRQKSDAEVASMLR